ncbi:type I polyketide synthase [Streptomyces kronopolitis]|uniref:type I polyketide synthase n=1 Tax=Streptomyces kronopolitis TaxID=1612435 RepID=UPI0020C051E2|nr:type I polyketide synthase [Streptomyces kronopolitis]MCL6299476.1 alpha/beta fold hydrolase [Streptomyces kronopolitis]
MTDEVKDPIEATDIAVVGLAGRWAGAEDIGEFWQNLLAGRESAKPIPDEEFLAAGGSPADLAAPDVVRMASTIDGIALFDADFFGYSPAEAKLLDPQQRLFLETCQHALEHAGYDPERFGGEVGVYAGSSQSEYFLNHIHPRYAAEGASLAMAAAKSANMADALATRVSFELNLTGPSLSVQTACSTSLVAVHLACQDLLSYRCDTALAGGAALNPSACLGYRYVRQGVLSPDGRTRAFDAEADGTIRGDGVAAVVLRRLDDAVTAGDRVYAVIKGSAINNDGRRKPGYTTPSPDGQMEVILAAQLAAGVSGDTISYIEAHGTGTAVGDPIEVDALTRAFRQTTDRSGFCTLGSVKPNVGHTDAAAGITGLIKAVLAIEHRKLPPTAGYRAPSQSIDFASTPFRVCIGAAPWEPTDGGLLRAGVSSFGVGGTNAHVILEEPPQRQETVEDQGSAHLLRISARTPAQLASSCTRLADHLDDHPDLRLEDVAHTLDVGRRRFPYRTAVAVSAATEAPTLLRAAAYQPAQQPADGRRVAFLLPGAGAQHPGMGADLYRTEPIFRKQIDRASAALREPLGYELADELYGGLEPAQPARLAAMLAVEYALAAVLADRGVTPAALLGHSLGEYTAACLAGVMTLEDALALVNARELLGHRIGGAAVGVWLPKEELLPHLVHYEVDLATVNSKASCTVSGPEAAVAALEQRLEASDVEYTRIKLRAAPHSRLLDPVLPEFADLIAKVPLSEPLIPFISNVTGTWITPQEATDPAYWVRHMRETVQFADGLTELTRPEGTVLAEVGPGRGLSRHARTHLGPAARAIPVMRHAKDARSDATALLNGIGQLWAAGVVPERQHAAGQRRVPLPGYPFERKRYWVDRVRRTAGLGTSTTAGTTPDPNNASPDTARGLHQPENSSAASCPTAADTFTAPRTALEQELTQHWQVMLDIGTIGVQDNFFDLGGDSLLALRLVNRICAATGRTLSVASLMEHPTIAALASHLADDQGASTGGALSVVLKLRSSGSRTPLFCVHPVGGISWPYARMLPAIDEQHPVFGVQCRGLTDPAAMPRTIEEMAADYVEEIRAIQPSGPYALVGGSFGGLVAHAMAVQLELQGQQVALLATLDAFPPTPEDLSRLPDAAEIDAFLMRMLLTEAGITLRVDEPAPDVPAVLSRLRGSDSALSGIDEESLCRISEVMLHNTRLMSHYTPGRFSGSLIAFTATEKSSDTSVLAPRWVPYTAGTVENHDLACDHESLLHAQSLQAIGIKLNQWLKKLD